MPLTDQELDAVWHFCSRHRGAVERSARCGCFSCGAMFSPSEIREWVDEPAQPALGLPSAPQATAACPRCSLDAVLPGSRVSLTAALLGQMYERFFRELTPGVRIGPTGPADDE